MWGLKKVFWPVPSKATSLLKQRSNIGKWLSTKGNKNFLFIYVYCITVPQNLSIISSNFCLFSRKQLLLINYFCSTFIIYFSHLIERSPRIQLSTFFLPILSIFLPLYQISVCLLCFLSQKEIITSLYLN